MAEPVKAVPVPVALEAEAVPVAEVHEAAQADHQLAVAVARVKVASAPNVRSVRLNARGMAHQYVATFWRTWLR